MLVIDIDVKIDEIEVSTDEDFVKVNEAGRFWTSPVSPSSQSGVGAGTASAKPASKKRDTGRLAPIKLVARRVSGTWRASAALELLAVCEGVRVIVTGCSEVAVGKGGMDVGVALGNTLSGKA